MTLERAALLAAIGVLLRGLHYWVANVVPSWNSSGVMEQISLVVVAMVDPLVWACYFGAVWRGWPTRVAAAWAAAVLGLAEIGFAAYRQWESLSLLSLDSLAFLFGGVVPVVLWAVYLVARWKPGLWYLLLFGLSQVALFIYQVVSSWPLTRDYWREEPWQLLAAPAIWIVYWVTQTLFVRSAQIKA